MSKGEVSPDGRSFRWQWEDLFEEDGFPSDVWSEEIFVLVVRNLEKMAEKEHYRNGLLIFADVELPYEPKEAGWWRWIKPESVEGFDIEKKHFFEMTMSIVLSMMHTLLDQGDEHLLLAFHHQHKFIRPILWI